VTSLLCVCLSLSLSEAGTTGTGEETGAMGDKKGVYSGGVTHCPIRIFPFSFLLIFFSLPSFVVQADSGHRRQWDLQEYEEKAKKRGEEGKGVTLDCIFGLDLVIGLAHSPPRSLVGCDFSVCVCVCVCDSHDCAHDDEGVPPGERLQGRLDGKCRANAGGERDGGCCWAGVLLQSVRLRGEGLH